MLRKGILIIILFLFRIYISHDNVADSTGYRSEESDILYDYTQERFQLALKSGKPTILDFSADWCPPCRFTSPIIEELRVEYTGKVNILTANADNERDLVGKYAATWYPTFVFFDDKGRQVQKIQGVLYREDFEVIIDELLRTSETSLALVIKIISPSEVMEKLEGGEEVYLIDVRTHGEYNAGHINGAILLPLSEIKQGNIKLDIGKGKEIIVYCERGIRCRSAAKMLAMHGYTNVKNMGGILDWIEVGGELYSSS